MNQDDLKLAAASAALAWVEAERPIGVGTGSTTNLFIDALGRHELKPSLAVSSSTASTERLAAIGIPVAELETVGRLAVYVDGADEATRDGRLIKGGGGALTREKIVASAADLFVCIVDETKVVERLGAFPVAVEVIAMARRTVARSLERLGGRPVPREGFVTDNGHPILDVHDLDLSDPVAMEQAIDGLAGVVASGLFCRRGADVLVIGRQDGVEKINLIGA